MKRFTETDKWRDKWFRELPAKYKALWQYLCDTCDNAGVWNVDLGAAEFLIGEPMVEAEIKNHFGDRIRDLKNGKWWIPKFIEFQSGELKEDVRPHQHILNLLRRHGIYTIYLDYLKGIHTLQDKEKDKEQEKDKGESEGKTEKPTKPIEQDLAIPTKLKTQLFMNRWGVWMNVRRGLKKPKDWRILFQEQLDWLAKFPPDTATEILSRSIRNGWIGLFELNGKGGIHTAEPHETQETISVKTLI